MKKILYLFLLLCLTSHLYAQKFTRLGNGFNSYAQSIFADTLENKIYVTGNFYEPSAPQNNFCYGDIATWDINGEGFQKEWVYATESCGANASIAPFVRFKNKLYLFGNCLKVNDSIGYYYDLSVLENGIWKPAGDIFTGAFVSCVIVVGDSVMYIGGEFSSFGGVATSNIVKYDGKNFYAFPEIANNYTAVDALAWYKGELYAGGNFGNISGGDAAKWNGNKWELIGGGIKGGIEHVNDFIIYDNMLIVAGSFWKANGNPGNCVAAWDGQHWHTMGENSFLDLGQIWDLEIYRGELYAGGAFDYTYPLSSSLSKWNGTEWERQAIFKVLPNDDKWGAVASMTVLNDELYITGSFRMVNGVDANNVVKYSSTQVDTPIIPEPPLSNDFELYPNPCITGTLILKNTALDNAQILLYNDLGQAITAKSISQNGKNVEISLSDSQADGVYYLHLNEGGRRIRTKWVLMR